MSTNVIKIIIEGVDRASGPLGAVRVAMGGIGALAGGAVVAGLAAATAATVGFGVASVDVAKDFEQQMSGVSAILGGSTEELKQLSDVALQLGLDPNLTVSATGAAAAMEMLAKNGLTAQQIMDGAARATVLLANATKADFTQAADIATSAMSVFKIKAEDMVGAVDQISGVTTSSKFDINDYALALAQGGGAAAALGVSFEDFNTTLTAISPLFASGSDAGTSFKTMLMHLVPSSDEAATMMKSLGLEFFDSEGKMKSMSDIAGELNRVFNGSVTTMTEVGGRTAAQNDELQRLQKAYNSTLTSIQDYTTGVKGAGLSDEARAKKIAELNTQLGNTQAAMKPLQSIQGSLVQSTHKLTDAERNNALQTIFGTDAMRAAVGLAEVGSDKFAELAGTIGDTSATEAAKIRVDNLAGAMDILGGSVEGAQIMLGNLALPGLKQTALDLATNISTLTTDFGTFTTALQTSDNPLGLVKDKILEIAPGLAPIVTGIQNVTTAFATNVPMVQAHVATMTGFLQSQFGMVGPQIAGNIGTALTTIAGFWSQHGNEVMTIVTVTFMTITAIIGGTTALISGLMAAFVGGATGAWTTLSLLLQGNWQGAWDNVVATTASNGNILLGTFETFMNTILALTGTNLEEFRQTWSNNFAMLWILVNTSLTNIRLLIWTGLFVVSNFLYNWFTGVIATWTANWNNLKLIVTTVWNNILTDLGTFVSKMEQAGIDLINGMVTGVLSAVGGLIGAVVGGVQSALNAAQNLISGGGGSTTTSGTGNNQTYPSEPDVAPDRPGNTATANNGGRTGAGQLALAGAGGNMTFNFNFTFNGYGSANRLSAEELAQKTIPIIKRELKDFFSSGRRG